MVKVVVSRSVSEATSDPKALTVAADELTAITGQKASLRKAKKSIANFKLKEGTPIGAMVTLRGERMYDFLYKLINLCLPKIRDFRGVNPASFDGGGSYSMGLKEQLIFPEINYDKVDKIRGMNITIVTTAKKDEETRENQQKSSMIVLAGPGGEAFVRQDLTERFRRVCAALGQPEQH